MKTKNKTNSQMEIMGMMMVVILIVIGIFIFLVLSLNSHTSDQRQIFLQKQLSQNTLNALLKTSLHDCGNEVEVSDLIKNCHKYSCYDENEERLISGCVYLNNTLNMLLNETITQISNYNYEFFVYDSEISNFRENHNIYINKSSCKYVENKEVGISQIPYNNGNILVVRLEIC